MNLLTRVRWSLAAMVSAAVLIAGAGWLSARELLIGEFDRALLDRAQRYSVAVGSLVSVRLPDSPGQGSWYVRVVDDDGDVVYSRGGDWPRGLPTRLASDGTIVEALAACGKTYRLVQLPATGTIAGALPNDQPRRLIGATDATPLRLNLRRLAILLAALTVPAVLGALAIAGFMRKALVSPISRLVEGIQRLPDADLDARLDAGGQPSELRLVVLRINQLLDRLGAARTRERRTIADIAHELRTPLAALRAEVEFAIAGAPSPRLGRILARVEALDGRVQRLLLLNRLDAGSDHLRAEPLSLSDVVLDAWALHGAATRTARRPELLIDDPRHAAIMGDPDLVATLAQNLVGNAIAHGCGPLVVRVRVDGGEVRCSFANAVVGQAPGDRSEAFRAFWRGDSSRSGGEHHCGLGLALVKRIVEAHGGAVGAEVDGESRFVVSLRWPAAESPPIASRATPPVESALAQRRPGEPRTSGGDGAR